MRSVHSYTDNSDPLSIHPIAKKTTSTRASRPNRHSASAAATSTPDLSHGSSKPAAPPLIRADAATLQPQADPPRDTNHHVLALTPTTRSAAQDTANMPPGDKSRQQQPGALAAKPIARLPLTPKVALKAAPPPPPSSSQGHQSSANLHGRDAPVAYVNGTTARSGPRQSRGNSAGTTPSSTPNPERSSDTWDLHPHPHPQAGRPSPKPPLVRTESHGSIRQTPDDSRGDSRSDARSNTPKFMYSSEVKPPPSLTRPSSMQQKTAPTFFYASEAPPSKRSANPPANPTTSPPSKFFYANGTPELSSAASRPPLAAIPSSGSGSSASTASRMVSVRPTTGNSTPGYGAPALARPDSPAKGGSSSSTVSTNTNITTNTATTSKPSRSSMTSPASPNRNQVYAPPTIAAATNPAKRRVSIDAPPKVAKGHVRAGSVPSTDAFNATKFVMPTVVPTAEPTSPPRSPGPPRVSMASLLQVAAEVNEGNGDTDDDDDDDDDDDEAEDDDDDGEDGGSGNSDSGEDGDGSADDVSERGSHSPSKSSPSKAPVSDYVLSARRERKVQDLEIRNTSLEAINKTLERQLRKQSAELRRFRRLSRAGKLPRDAAAQPRDTSEAPSELSDLSEEESVATTMEDGEEEEEEEEEKEEEEDSYVSEDSSSTASAQSDDSSRRKRDERRLHHDLSRHKELLQDSQRMNQSLKRCLNWTEELIKEGQKALAHQVRVSDVQFGYGGRVLSPPDEDEDEEDNADGASQPADETVTSLGSVNPWVKGAQDRDSGIELPVDSG